MKEFDLKGKHYRLIDFENEFSFEQGEFGKIIYSEVMSNIQEFSKNMPKNKEEKNYNIDEVNKMMSSVSSKQIKEILALCYIEDGKEYDEEMYKRNLESFKRLPISLMPEFKGVLKSFFGSITQYITGVLQVFSAVTETQTKQIGTT